MRYLFVAGASLLLSSLSVFAQYPVTQGTILIRNNSNGNPNSCPNVAGNPIASNFTGTPYATVPAFAKSGIFRLTYPGTNAGLLPYTITKVWQTVGTTSTEIASFFGPAAPPDISSGTVTEVDYCFYGANMPNTGTLTFQMTNPQTGLAADYYSYDATCTSNCTAITGPASLLPVTFTGFKAMVGQGRAALLDWTTGTEQNNKGYTVERSIDGGAFEVIGFVPTANPGGNSSMPTKYSYTDLNVPVGQNIGYRLRQEDLDGKVLYSEIQALQLTTTGGPGIYSDGTAITVLLQKASSIIVHDTEGRMLRQVRVTAARQYRIADLPGGHLYYISVREDGNAPPTVKPVFLNAR